MLFRKLIPFSVLCFIFSSCIKNDLPYPYIEGLILDISVEGQKAAPTISKDTRTVSFVVNDSVSLSSIRIKRLMITDNATVTPDATACLNAAKFPTQSFASLLNIPLTADTRFNAEKPFQLTIQTYQTYPWTIKVSQDMNRRVAFQSQVGEAVIDAHNHTVNVYVSADQDLSAIKINELKLGLAEAKTLPDPATVTNFFYPQTFNVYNEENTPERWVVSVFHTTTVVTTKQASAWAKKAYLTAEMKVGTGETPTFLYRKSSEASYTEVPSSAITINGASYTGEITGLTPGTDYVFKAKLGSNEGAEKSFTTEKAEQVPNLSFENWYKEKTTWYPDVDLTSANYFWDSGNKGTNLLSEKNPTSPEYTDVVSGTACRMASTAVVGVFAAGSLISGEFVKVVGLGAEMSFGRPYTSRPTSMKGYYKYQSGVIDKTKDPYAALAGRQDTCHIYIALFDNGESYTVNTTKNIFVDTSRNNPNLVAYGELKDGNSFSNYKEFNIPLTYYKNTSKPTHILIVASSSKYGDYFTGSTSSVLLLDEMELVF